MDRRLRVLAFAVVGAVWSCSPHRPVDPSRLRAADAVRQLHVDQMVALIIEYADSSGGAPPFADRAVEQPFMVFIGIGEAHEDSMANVPALKRGARWGNAADLESELTRVLKRRIVLPRDPQRIATFAPNVYIYFVTGRTWCAVAHLSAPSRISEPYTWAGGTFHSHARCLEPT